MASVSSRLSAFEHDLTESTETPFYDLRSDQAALQDSLKKMRSSDFIAWDASFFNLVGPDAKLERIQSFVGQPARVHEAPAYVPETNELFFSDTAETGWLWAINVDTHEVQYLVLPRRISLS